MSDGWKAVYDCSTWFKNREHGGQIICRNPAFVLDAQKPWELYRHGKPPHKSYHATLDDAKKAYRHLIGLNCKPEIHTD